MGGGVKQKKKGRKKGGSGDWDQVPIGEEFLGQQEMDSLISLQVLTDYEIYKRPDGLTEIITAADKKNKGNANNKRKFAEADTLLDSDDSEIEGSSMDNIGSMKDASDFQTSDPEHETSTSVDCNPKKKLKLDNVQQKSKKIEAIKMVQSDKVPVTATSSWKISRSVESDQNIHPQIDKKKKEVIKKKPKKSLEKPNNNKKNVIVNNSEQESSESDVSMEEWVKAGVRDPVLRALKESSFHKPTAIQSMTLPASILGKKDVVGAAETGSGKTLAFAIPIIQGILLDREKQVDDETSIGGGLKALILTPTRELAVQIKKHFDVAAKYAKIKTVVIVGGLAAQKQERLLRGQPDVVIGTPGRLWELCKEGDQHLSTLNRIRYLAVDETDRMVERGHFQELQGILGLLNETDTQKSNRQNFVFSATLAFTHDPPKRLNTKKFKSKTPKKITAKDKLKQIMEMIGVRPNPKIVDITSSKGTCETLQEMQINCPANKKDYYIYYFLIKHPGRTIVFCNSINTVRRLTNLFFLLKCRQVLPLHSEMNQKMRLRNLEKFAEDDKSVLIATDVAARGLDIVDIQHVVHYEIPKTAESYIHRSGRTARAFKGGIAIVLVEPSEIGKLKNIFRSLNRDPDKMLPLFAIDGEVFKQLKARVDEADKVEKFEHTVRKKLADLNWMDKAKKEMDLASSEDENVEGMDEDSGTGEQRNRRNLLQAKKKLESYKKTLNKLLEDNSFLSELNEN